MALPPAINNCASIDILEGTYPCFTTLCFILLYTEFNSTPNTNLSSKEPMKKFIAFLAVVFFTMTASTSLASPLASDKKATAHKHQDKNCCCCDMKTTKGDKKNDCSKMDSKKDEAKKGSDAK